MMQNENSVHQTLQNWTQALYETNKAITQNAIAAQERNVRFTQQVYEGGIEVLKSHAEATRDLLQTRPQNQREATQVIVESTLKAQERNMQFARAVLNRGTEVLKSHVDAAQGLVQALAGQVKEQEAAFSMQPYVDAYVSMLNAPFSYYKQAIETAQTLTQQAMEVAQQSTQQSIEVSQKVAQQIIEATEAASRQER